VALIAVKPAEQYDGRGLPPQAAVLLPVSAEKVVVVWACAAGKAMRSSRKERYKRGIGTTLLAAGLQWRTAGEPRGFTYVYNYVTGDDRGSKFKMMP
jgi:hypothetical protein